MTSSSPHIFDRARVRRNRAAMAGGMGFLADHAAMLLAERLDDVRREFPLALQIGARDENGAMARHPKIGRLVRADLHGGDLAMDEELLPFAPASFDLVLSPFALHTVNDVPGALIQIRRALRPDGLFLAAFPGGETLFELRESLMQAEMSLRGGVSPRLYPFMDKPQAGALMQRAHFALPVVDSERVTVTYDDPLKLLRELRLMGEGAAVAARSRAVPPRRLFAAAADYYRRHFSDPDGRVRATFEFITLTGWAPHESQQQPLKPGSGKISLADALGTHEQGTGEKP